MRVHTSSKRKKIGARQKGSQLLLQKQNCWNWPKIFFLIWLISKYIWKLTNKLKLWYHISVDRSIIIKIFPGINQLLFISLCHVSVGHSAFNSEGVLLVLQLKNGEYDFRNLESFFKEVIKNNYDRFNALRHMHIVHDL